MGRSETYNHWIEAGYEQFAKEGLDGLPVEKLARIISKNKSGFYHYFENMENFCRQLVNHHSTMTDLFLREVMECKNLDPEFLNLLIKYKISILAQMQLVRVKTNPLFLDAYKILDDKEIDTSNKIWKKHIGIHDDPELVRKYLYLVRDMFYSRITFENFNYDYLHSLSDEIRDFIVKIIFEKGNSVRVSE